MKIKSLQISNILVFKYIDDIANAEKISFDKNFNILIGQNGAGKSTVLEVINFIFRRVLFVPYNRNRDLYNQRANLEQNQKRTILVKPNNLQYYREFRLERNYDFDKNTQKIRVFIELDDIDRANISLLRLNKEKLSKIVGFYSSEQMFADGTFQNEYQIDIELNDTDKSYSVNVAQDPGYTYLTAYNLYKEAIELHNEENPQDLIANLTESFSLIGSYRNYNTYTVHASLGGGNTAEKQIAQIRSSEFVRSTNATEEKEPSIFSLVRLRMAGECFNLITTSKTSCECEIMANELDFIKAINEKIAIVKLKVEIKLIDVSSWNFAFNFIDTKRKKAVSNINSLSAGQKAIVHLVFEAYGRGGLKGGLVIIDEPEIHLHYQFQNEYLRVIEKLNKEQGCQYILVTHSEALINSTTISSVIRLSLDKDGYTKINKPIIDTVQKWLVKILDNTRSTHAFFGSKVVLVEGESDQYFFRSLLGEIEEKNKKGVVQDITILNINGKGKFEEWRVLFGSFGLKTFFITDLDYSWKFYPTENVMKINTPTLVQSFLSSHSDVISKIESEYINHIYILKNGDLEIYLGIQKNLSNVISFCQTSIKNYISGTDDAKNKEIKTIMSEITEENEDNLW